MKIFGIPVKIEFSFWLIAAFLGGRRLSEPELLVEWIIVVFVSILLHEFGHALTGRAFGLAPEIRLHSFGGLTSWREEKATSPKRNIAISLAGPGAGLLFGGLVFLMGRSFSELQESRLWDVAYFDLLWVNWGWSIFNLLPILPLDGGHVMRSLEEWGSRRTGGLISHAVSLILAGGIAAWAISLGSLWIGLLGAWFAFSNASVLYRQWQRHRDRSWRSPLDQARETLKNQQGDAAARQAEEVWKSARTDAVKREALELMVRGYLQAGDFERASIELERLEAHHGPQPALETRLHIARGEWSSAIPLLAAEFNRQPSPQAGQLLVQILCRAGRCKDAFHFCAGPQMAEWRQAIYPVLQTEAFHAGEYELSAEAGRLAFEQKSDPEVAYNVGCALARASRTDEALEWIARAVEAGYQDSAFLANDPDLADLRVHPRFELICRRLLESKA